MSTTLTYDQITLAATNKKLALAQSANWLAYRSFKTVRAARFQEIPEFTPNQEVGRVVVAWIDSAGEDVYQSIVINPKQLFSRGLAKVGDYYVVYEDGYDSWSPKDAFEKGYLLLSGSPEDNLSLNATKQDWNFIRSLVEDGLLLGDGLVDEEEREAVKGFLRMTEECVAKPVEEEVKDNV